MPTELKGELYNDRRPVDFQGFSLLGLYVILHIPHFISGPLKAAAHAVLQSHPESAGVDELLSVSEPHR